MQRKTVLMLILAFVATALIGLSVRELTTPQFTMRLFSPPDYREAFDSLVYRFLLYFLWLPLTVLVAMVAGYASPKRFWLWGFSAICLWPVEEVVSNLNAARAGAIGPSDYVGLVFVEVLIFVALVFLCTVGSGVGAGLRLLMGWISRRRTQGAPPG